MSVDLAELLSRLDGAARRGAFDEFETLVAQAVAVLAGLPAESQHEAVRARRAIAALRGELVRSAGFIAENERLSAELAAAETMGETGRARRLSEALYRRGKAIMATLRTPGEETEPRDEPVQALFVAIASGDTDRVRARLAGAEIDARHGPLQETALYHALSVEGRSVEMVRLLLSLGADPNAGMAEGYRPLHAVAAYPWGWETASAKALLADLLVEAGADIEARTETWGWTPLHRAVLEGTADEVEALLRAGADPNMPFDGRSEPWFTPGRLPLQIAGHDTAKVRLLLDYGADPKKTDALGDDTATYLRSLIAEHIARRAEEDAHREGLERSLAMVSGWPARS
ncbi:ankyrin repeat domain-containing protein [Rhodovulum euryhalinum]|uniref:Ankyrin repeat protein n=1 Tax=Rhodovulum euryhalinum TaxID=35805 RepID=A0A4R2KI20_9RHOB|nr:ankyrin repeat domain-containing protein [Rhodovulum euryhalinum]TCO72814.1 ankyrin repeat protein [Rhodovulum euryhalinum]